MSAASTAKNIEATENPANLTGENFADLFENYVSNREKREGTIITGRVVALIDDFVLIDVGAKAEGRVPLREFAITGDDKEIKVGDDVEVYLEKFENRNGEAMLSREKAIREKAWVRLEDACKNAERVNGQIFGRVKGGFTVQLPGAVAFLPGSQVDIRPIKDVDPLMNVEQPFIVLKMDRKRGNIVVSRRAILEESRFEQRNELLGKIGEGMILDGMVKNITDYGAFIDLGGVDGLLHVTDISWKRINHPSEMLSLGQNIKVIVTKYNTETKRVSLGMKQLEENPWKDIPNRFPAGTKVKGKITTIADYGVFVEIEPGVEGLVHVSELSWTKKNVNPNKVVSVGQEVEAKVLDVDIDKHRISLGIKQCEENPWAKFAEKFKEGDIIEGNINNITEFGLFVGLDGEIDGLIHANDLSWTEPAEQAIKQFSKGSSVKAKVLSIDSDKERVSLGIKQLSDDPLEASFSGIKKGAVITCQVSAVKEDGIEVTVTGNLKAFIKRGDLSKDKKEQRPERFAVGDRVDAKVISFDKSNRKIGLSIKALEAEEEKKAIEAYGSTDSGASLGDILGAALKSSGNKSE